MLNLKKMVSALLGVTMVANMALSIPAFAEETVDRTYVCTMTMKLRTM